MAISFYISKLPEMYFGTGKIHKAAELTNRYGKNVILVTGNSFFKRNHLGERLLSDLKSLNIREEIVTISGEPTTGNIDEAVRKLRDFNANSVIAIGGGSVLDAGKAISAMIPVEGNTWDYLEGNPAIKPHPGKKLPFIAVPTTAGTGSEATKNAVLSTTGSTVLKRSLRHDEFTPNIAIVDPELSTTCPPGVTGSSGLDAITQLLEAYVSTNASPFTDALAINGLQKALNSIYKATANGNDLEARSGMAYAALLSGIVLANAGLGAVHGFASVLGGYYKIPHGVICGTLLAQVTKRNIEKLQQSSTGIVYLEKYVESGKLFCDKKDKSDNYYLNLLVDRLEELIEKLDIPKLGKYGVKTVDTIYLAKETGIKNNPVLLDQDDLEDILKSRI